MTSTRRRRRKRLAVWAAFFAIPIVVIFCLIWPKTPDLPISYWSWNITIMNTNPQQGGYSGCWIKAPLLKEGLRSTYSMTEGDERTWTEYQYRGVTGSKAVFEFTIMAQEHHGADWQTVREGAALLEVPLGGKSEVEVWPGMTVLGEFQHSGKGWRDQWDRWREIFQ